LNLSLRTNGLLVMHDTLLHEGPARAVEQLMPRGRFEGLTLDTPRRLHVEGMRSPVPMGGTILRKRAEGLAIFPRGALLAMDEHVPFGPEPLPR
jgi:hypothetical protein